MRKLILFFILTAGTLAAQSLAGVYKGNWNGAASGDFTLTLTGDEGNYKASVVFTLGNDEISTKVTSVKVEGDKINVIYQYDLQGLQLQSDVKGQRKGKVIEGTYKATTVTDGGVVDEGTWKVAVQ